MNRRGLDGLLNVERNVHVESYSIALPLHILRCFEKIYLITFFELHRQFTEKKLDSFYRQC